MKSKRLPFSLFAILLPLVLASSLACYAQTDQTDTKVKVETKTPQKGSGTISVSAEPASAVKETNPGVEFSALGGDIARPAVKIPEGATTVLQMSAPLGKSQSESVLVHVYKRNDALFMDILTGKGKLAWTRRNSVRLLAPYPEHPENLKVTMRYLEPRKKNKGLMIVASDDAMHYVLAFPKGLGATVTQQQFLTTSKSGTQSSYQFSELDGRGFAIVKATVVSAGNAKTADTLQYFVWNGSKFIPRAYN